MKTEQNPLHGLEGTPLGDAAQKGTEDKKEEPLIKRLTPEELRKKRLEELAENDPHTDIGY